MADNGWPFWCVWKMEKKPVTKIRNVSRAQIVRHILLSASASKQQTNESNWNCSKWSIAKKSAAQFIAMSHQKTEQSSVSWAYDNGKFSSRFRAPRLAKSFELPQCQKRTWWIFGCEQKKKPKNSEKIEINAIASTYIFCVQWLGVWFPFKPLILN